MQFHVAVVGSFNLDHMLYVKNFVKAGQTILADDATIRMGGKGFNQAMGCIALNDHCVLFTCLGNDGQNYVHTMAHLGLKTDCIELVDDVTGSAFIQLDQTKENCIVVAPGANNAVSVAYLKRHEDVLTHGQVVMTQLEIPMETIDYLSQLCHDHDIPLLLNPAPAVKLSDAILRHVTWLTPNQGELSILTDMPTETMEQTIAAARYLVDKGVKHVVVTMGSLGCLYVDDTRLEQVDAYKVDVVDTVGAGDCFNAAFVHAMMDHHDPIYACKFANAAAALAIQSKDSYSAATIDNVLAFLKAHEN